jgi:hypothetical protein
LARQGYSHAEGFENVQGVTHIASEVLSEPGTQVDDGVGLSS